MIRIRSLYWPDVFVKGNYYQDQLDVYKRINNSKQVVTRKITAKSNDAGLDGLEESVDEEHSLIE